MSNRFILGVSNEILIVFIVLPWITIQINKQLGLPVISSTIFTILGSILLLIGAALIILSTHEIFLKPKQVMVSPFKSPPKLVTTGLLEYTRNPMYIGYFCVVMAEFLFFGDVLLLGYFAVLVLFVHFMVVYVEEKQLERSFGDEYVKYRRRVPRWIPCRRE